MTAPASRFRVKLVREKLIDEMIDQMRAAIEEARLQDDKKARTGFMRQQGRHRSVFAAFIKQAIAEDLSFNFRMVRWHSQTYPEFDMRRDCGCGEPGGLCRNSQRRARDERIPENEYISQFAFAHEVADHLLKRMIERRSEKLIGLDVTIDGEEAEEEVCQGQKFPQA